MPEARLRRCREANPELSGRVNLHAYYLRRLTELQLLAPQPPFFLSEQPDADIAEPTADTPWGV